MKRRKWTLEPTRKTKRARAVKRKAARRSPRAGGAAIARVQRARERVSPAAASAGTSAAIDAALKGAVLAVEPPINADRAALDTAFVTKLDAALAELTAQGRPFKLVEGFRTTERQQWLFGSGRPTAVPHGRPGPIVTNADGVLKRSKHQGSGVAGSGRAADCYPTRNGKVFIPPNTDPLWAAYAAAVVAQGLVAGHNFSSIKDSPHCELV